MAFTSLVTTIFRRVTSCAPVLRNGYQTLLIQPTTTPMILEAPSCSLFAGVTRMGFSTTSVCANVREHFPRPNERKRITRHGWNKRMSTPAGRRILMRRILKGRHVLSH